MATRHERRYDEALGEEDLAQLMSEEQVFPAPAGDAYAMGGWRAAPDAGGPTPEELVLLLEGDGDGPEIGMLHVEDAVTEVLDDERELSDEDFSGDAADELEWRITGEGD